MAREQALRKTEMQSMMEIYQELATPGAPHKLLTGMAGSWSVQGFCWMEPGEPPIGHTGRSEQKMVLGGRFLQQEFIGEMMGRPFTGIGFMGYNNHTGKFISTWMDTMGTGIYFFEGIAGPDGRTITQNCSYDDPVRGQLKWRSVTRMVDHDTMQFVMYTTDKSGREEKMGEMTYTRKA